jgi:hypothetical protein
MRVLSSEHCWVRNLFSALDPVMLGLPTDFSLGLPTDFSLGLPTDFSQGQPSFLEYFRLETASNGVDLISTMNGIFQTGEF